MLPVLDVLYLYFDMKHTKYLYDFVETLCK